MEKLMNKCLPNYKKEVVFCHVTYALLAEKEE